MASPTWFEEELPVLEAIREAEVEHGAPLLYGYARRLTPFDDDQFKSVLRRLDHGGYVRGSYDRGTASSPPALYEVELSAEGRRAVGQWPTPDDALTDLVVVLREVAASMSAGDERTTLERAADQMQDVLSTTAAGLVLAGIKAKLGLP